MRTYTGLIMTLEPDQIFVFGSNTQGKHSKGAAKLAYKYFGAHYGQAEGIQGRTYAICTKNLESKEHPSVPKNLIIKQIRVLYDFADTVLKDFLVAYTLSTNLNGYTPQEMADMFGQAGPIPKNIVFNDDFAKLIDTSLWASRIFK